MHCERIALPAELRPPESRRSRSEGELKVSPRATPCRRAGRASSGQTGRVRAAAGCAHRGSHDEVPCVAGRSRNFSSHDVFPSRRAESGPAVQRVDRQRDGLAADAVMNYRTQVVVRFETPESLALARSGCRTWNHLRFSARFDRPAEIVERQARQGNPGATRTIETPRVL